MSPNDIGGWTVGCILILVFFSYLYFTNPWRDLIAPAAAPAAAAAATAAITGGGYLLRKYMKNKKSHKKRK